MRYWFSSFIRSSIGIGLLREVIAFIFAFTRSKDGFAIFTRLVREADDGCTKKETPDF
jgi:hypothetical protein